jgi:acyl carrier protein
MKRALRLLAIAFFPLLLGLMAFFVAIDTELSSGQKLGAFSFLAVCLAFVIFATKHEMKRQREAESKMRREQAIRTVLSDADFAVECGTSISADVAGRVRKILAEVSETSLGLEDEIVRPELIRPSDCLVGNLALDLDSLAMIDLFANLKKEFGVRVRFREYINETLTLRTVGDVVRLVSERMTPKEQG